MLRISTLLAIVIHCGAISSSVGDCGERCSENSFPTQKQWQTHSYPTNSVNCGYGQLQGIGCNSQNWQFPATGTNSVTGSGNSWRRTDTSTSTSGCQGACAENNSRPQYPWPTQSNPTNSLNCGYGQSQGTGCNSRNYQFPATGTNGATRFGEPSRRFDTSSITNGCLGECIANYPWAQFMRHTDSTKYCTCVFGRALPMNCGPGTEWSQTYTTCVMATGGISKRSTDEVV